MSAGPTHFALLVRSMTGGGLERIVVTLANGFAQRGHHTTLLVGVPQGSARAELSPEVGLIALPAASHVGGRVWAMRAGRGDLPSLLPFLLGASPRMLRHGHGLVRHLRRNRVDVLLSAGTQSNLVALWARRLAGVAVRVVISEHNTMSAVATHARHAFRRSYPILARRNYADADAIIAVSNGVAEDLRRVTGIARERITAIPNPVVSPELRVRADEPVDHPWLGNGGTAPVILAVGRLHRQKDFPTLLRAFRRVRAAAPARLVILGEGEERRGLEKLARRLGIASDLLLPGFVTNPFAWMARASLFVCSSAWEGNPTVIVEALACGCPVVSTDCPSGPAEILAGGSYGPLVPVGDDRALADAILTVLGETADRDRLRERAALFDRDRAIDRYLDVLLDGLV